MRPGAISVKRLLTDRDFVISDDKADKLWAEIKDHWQQIDPDDNSLIVEIEESSNGKLDAFPREALLEAVSKVCASVVWPVNGDSEDVKTQSFFAISKGLAERGIVKVVFHG